MEAVINSALSDSKATAERSSPAGQGTARMVRRRWHAASINRLTANEDHSNQPVELIRHSLYLKPYRSLYLTSRVSHKSLSWKKKLKNKQIQCRHIKNRLYHMSFKEKNKIMQPWTKAIRKYISPICLMYEKYISEYISYIYIYENPAVWKIYVTLTDPQVENIYMNIISHCALCQLAHLICNLVCEYARRQVEIRWRICCDGQVNVLPAL